MMKKTLFFLIFICIGLVSSSQIINTRSYKPNYFQTQKNTPNNKSAQYMRLDSIISPAFKIDFRYMFIEETYEYLSIGEIFTDYFDQDFNYKIEIEYDSNYNITKNKGFSFLNNQWRYTSYEEFIKDSQGRDSIRINGNDLYGDGFVIGGKGFFHYNPNGQLVEYLQKIHMGNNVFENITKDSFYYDNDKLVLTLGYYYENSDWVLTYKEEYVYNPTSELLSNKLIYHYDDVNSLWINGSNYNWVRKPDGRVVERSIYGRGSGSNWTSQPIDKYEFLLSDDNGRYPYLPTYTMFNANWHDWFDRDVNGEFNIILKDYWWTENQNYGMLTFIDSSDYYYSFGSIGLNYISQEDQINVYPNPAKDYLYFNTITSNEIKSFRILNSLGYKVAESNIQIHSIPIENLSNGVYILELVSDKSILFRKKFIINK